MRISTLFNSATARKVAVCACLFAGGLFASAATIFLHDGLIWKVNKNKLELQKPGTACENGDAPTVYDGSYIIPLSITYQDVEYPVSSIKAGFKATDVVSVTITSGGAIAMDRGAFQNCTKLESVTLPSDLPKFLGDIFNGCSALKSITIPPTIVDIPSAVFAGCTSLVDFIVEDGTDPIALSSAAFSADSHVQHLVLNRAISTTKYTAMDDKPFRNNEALLKVELGGSCTALPASFFEGASNLAEVVITNDFTEFGTNVFAGTALTEFTCPANVTAISSSLFMSCKQLKTVTLGDKVTSIGGQAFYKSGVEQINLPESLKSIGTLAFASAKLSGDLVIPANVTSIGEQAFANNTGLTTVALPASVTSIGNGAFMGCTGIVSFSVDPANEVFAATADGKCLTSKDGLTLIAYAPAAEGTTFTADYTTVMPYAFYMAKNLTTVELPLCTNWGAYALYQTPITALTVRGTVDRYVAANCAALAEITIDCGTVPTGIAADCPALAKVTLLQPITIVRQDAFKNCTSLKELALGNILAILETDCFSGAGIEAITVSSFYPAAMAEGVFTEASNIVVTVPESLVETYKAANGWSYLTIQGDANLAVGGTSMGMPAGLYYAGDDNNLHCVYSDGQTDDYEVNLEHMFQLVEFSNRIYGASGGKKFWYSATSATEGDGVLFYISNVDGNVFQATVLDNTGNNAYMDPMGLYIYGSTLYVNDRNVCIRKISADALALPQNYPSWMENNWMPFYSNPWTYGCIKNGFAITQSQDAAGNPEPLYWVGMKYNGNGLFSFKEKNIGTSSSEVGSADGIGTYLSTLNMIATSFNIDEKNGDLYIYIETAGTQDSQVKGGLYRIKLEDLEQTPNPSASDFFEVLGAQLIDGSPVMYEGNATNEHVGISQLAIDANGEYMYWCYRAPTKEEAEAREAQDFATQAAGKYYWAEKYDETNPLHHSGIKRIKLGEANPTVEMVVEGVTGYGVVPVNYEGSKKPDGVNSVVADKSLDIINLNNGSLVSSEDAVIAIYNTAGVLVARVNATAGETVNTDNLNAGVYIVEARTASGSQALKIVK